MAGPLMHSVTIDGDADKIYEAHMEALKKEGN